MDLYTKHGRPLQVQGDQLYSASGIHLGSVRGGRIFDRRGRYAGTIDGDRVVYRSVESGMVGPTSSSGDLVGTARGRLVASAVWGDEPEFPD